MYFESGIEKHVLNQAYTFQALYERAKLNLFSCNENQAIQALYNDSCETIVITRLLSNEELKTFASKKHVPKYSLVAKTGMALVCNASLPVKKLSYADVISLVKESNSIPDSAGNSIQLNLLIDKNGSAIYHYIIDSLVHSDKLPNYFSSLNSSTETLAYVATHTNAVAFIDFAVLSDVDDLLYKSYSAKIRPLAIGAKTPNGKYERPHQSSFKLNTYPFTRNVYVMRKTGDFTLAKGFESFVAGPKGQTIFLKQGLLPSRQQERAISVNFEALNVKN